MMSERASGRGRLEDGTMHPGLAVHSVTIGGLLAGIALAVATPGDKYEPVPLPTRAR